MPKIRLTNKALAKYNEIQNLKLPPYVSTILNNANRFSQATRPEVVGQMTELFKEFLKETDEPSVDKWKNWYLQRYPNAINEAVSKILKKLEEMKNVMNKINEEMIKAWVEDLVITKTFIGMYYQRAILKKIAEIEGKDYRLATPEEESKGIDGFVGNTPISIKPKTYEHMDYLKENINAKIIEYIEEDDGISFEYEKN
ncbi:MjaI family restriction endonuclease [Carboxydothermus islandicus]|uniref:MjaI family restriction endonuclease n=1 Tax=Carboxydothermus islandicus TaxID=661089 RepID=A0A1L8D5T4_9THEO|nr:MjaI family restriction endonuclease [Carboxydothermus islandicus]GAV26484.1 MjaI family restriction endonuclease [Carboxydothermus islandicus]